MANDKKSQDQAAQESQKSRQELRERIQSLEWSLAAKNRENKRLIEQVEFCKQEVADLTAENNELKGNSESDDSKSG